MTAQSSALAGRTQLHYALLSDFCHPSVGRHILVMEFPQDAEEPTEGPTVLQFASTPSDEKMHWFCLNAVVPMVPQLAAVAEQSLKNAYRICRALEQGGEAREGGANNAPQRRAGEHDP